MKKRTKQLLACLLAVSFLMAFSLSSFATTQDAETQLQFNANGKFTILQFADCQDDALPAQAMLDFIERSLNVVEPDLVVYTGDNVSQPFEPLNRLAIEYIVKPVADRGIPYTFMFGNHDAEYLSKDKMFEHYMGIGNCITYDADPSITGMGTCNHTILSSDGSNIAFNLWIFDSNMYSDTGYDWVHQDQIDWYTSTSEALEIEAGYMVNSLVFQHIAVPEIYNCLNVVPEGTPDSKVYNGVTYELSLNPEIASGYLGEWPCPPNYNSGQFQAFVDRGDVLGIVTGHDHVNDFIGTYMGIDFIQSPGITFQSYGDDEVRGARVIVLNENDTSTYETFSLTYNDLFTQAEMTGFLISTPIVVLAQLVKAVEVIFEYLIGIVNSFIII